MARHESLSLTGSQKGDVWRFVSPDLDGTLVRFEDWDPTSLLPFQPPPGPILPPLIRAQLLWKEASLTFASTTKRPLFSWSITPAWVQHTHLSATHWNQILSSHPLVTPTLLGLTICDPSCVPELKHNDTFKDWKSKLSEAEKPTFLKIRYPALYKFLTESRHESPAPLLHARVHLIHMPPAISDTPLGRLIQEVDQQHPQGGFHWTDLVQYAKARPLQYTDVELLEWTYQNFVVIGSGRGIPSPSLVSSDWAAWRLEMKETVQDVWMLDPFNTSTIILTRTHDFDWNEWECAFPAHAVPSSHDGTAGWWCVVCPSLWKSRRVLLALRGEAWTTPKERSDALESSRWTTIPLPGRLTRESGLALPLLVGLFQAAFHRPYAPLDLMRHYVALARHPEATWEGITWRIVEDVLAHPFGMCQETIQLLFLLHWQGHGQGSRSLPVFIDKMWWTALFGLHRIVGEKGGDPEGSPPPMPTRQAPSSSLHSWEDCWAGFQHAFPNNDEHQSIACTAWMALESVSRSSSSSRGKEVSGYRLMPDKEWQDRLRVWQTAWSKAWQMGVRPVKTLAAKAPDALLLYTKPEELLQSVYIRFQGGGNDANACHEFWSYEGEGAEDPECGLYSLRRRLEWRKQEVILQPSDWQRTSSTSAALLSLCTVPLPLAYLEASRWKEVAEIQEEHLREEVLFKDHLPASFEEEWWCTASQRLNVAREATASLAITLPDAVAAAAAEWLEEKRESEDDSVPVKETLDPPLIALDLMRLYWWSTETLVINKVELDILRTRYDEAADQPPGFKICRTKGSHGSHLDVSWAVWHTWLRGCTNPDAFVVGHADYEQTEIVLQALTAALDVDWIEHVMMEDGIRLPWPVWLQQRLVQFLKRKRRPAALPVYFSYRTGWNPSLPRGLLTKWTVRVTDDEQWQLYGPHSTELPWISFRATAQDAWVDESRWDVWPVASPLPPLPSELGRHLSLPLWTWRSQTATRWRETTLLPWTTPTTLPVYSVDDVFAECPPVQVRDELWWKELAETMVKTSITQYATIHTLCRSLLLSALTDDWIWIESVRSDLEAEQWALVQEVQVILWMLFQHRVLIWVGEYHDTDPGLARGGLKVDTGATQLWHWSYWIGLLYKQFKTSTGLQLRGTGAAAPVPFLETYWSPSFLTRSLLGWLTSPEAPHQETAVFAMWKVLEELQKSSVRSVVWSWSANPLTKSQLKAYPWASAYILKIWHFIMASTGGAIRRETSGGLWDMKAWMCSSPLPAMYLSTLVQILQDLVLSSTWRTGTWEIPEHKRVTKWIDQPRLTGKFEPFDVGDANAPPLPSLTLMVARRHELDRRDKTTTPAQIARAKEWAGQQRLSLQRPLKFWQTENIRKILRDSLRLPWWAPIGSKNTRPALNHLLADEMGLGKSLCQELVALSTNRTWQERGPTLIITPVVETHIAELVNEAVYSNPVPTYYVHHPHLAEHRPVQGRVRTKLSQPFVSVADIVTGEYDFIITTPSVLQNEWDRCQGSSLFWCLRFWFVICDEAHVLKTSTSHTSFALRSLVSEHRLAATGTPVETDIQNLWSIGEFLRWELVLHRDWIHHWGEKQKQALLQTCMVRRMTSQLLDIEQDVCRIYCPCTPREGDVQRIARVALTRWIVQAGSSQIARPGISQMVASCSFPWVWHAQSPIRASDDLLHLFREQCEKALKGQLALPLVEPWMRRHAVAAAGAVQEKQMTWTRGNENDDDDTSVVWLSDLYNGLRVTAVKGGSDWFPTALLHPPSSLVEVWRDCGKMYTTRSLFHQLLIIPRPVLHEGKVRLLVHPSMLTAQVGDLEKLYYGQWNRKRIRLYKENRDAYRAEERRLYQSESALLGEGWAWYELLFRDWKTFVPKAYSYAVQPRAAAIPSATKKRAPADTTVESEEDLEERWTAFRTLQELLDRKWIQLAVPFSMDVFWSLEPSWTVAQAVLYYLYLDVGLIAPSSIHWCVWLGLTLEDGGTGGGTGGSPTPWHTRVPRLSPCLWKETDTWRKHMESTCLLWKWHNDLFLSAHADEKIVIAFRREITARWAEHVLLPWLMEMGISYAIATPEWSGGTLSLRDLETLYAHAPMWKVVREQHTSVSLLDPSKNLEMKLEGEDDRDRLLAWTCPAALQGQGPALARDAFQYAPRVQILFTSYRCSAYSVNLTAGRNSILYDAPEGVGEWVQFLRRMWRLSQKHRVVRVFPLESIARDGTPTAEHMQTLLLHKRQRVMAQTIDTQAERTKGVASQMEDDLYQMFRAVVAGGKPP